MAGSLDLQIRTGAVGEPAGYTSAIVRVDSAWYAMVDDGEPALLARQVGHLLRDLSHRLVADMGQTLHHATWTITSDPDQVLALGLMDDCATCRADFDQVLAYLREHPGREVAVGQLYWAEPAAQGGE